MSIFNDYWKSNYDELITFYPRFYRDVFEMDAILRAEGALADGIQSGIDSMLLNNFIDEASEETVAKLEAFLSHTTDDTKSLDERRRLLKAYFVGFGKISATMLKEMIYAYTNAEVEITFEPFDDEGNNRLNITISGDEVETFSVDDIGNIIEEKIPAHLAYIIVLPNTGSLVLYFASAVKEIKRIKFTTYSESGLDSLVYIVDENEDTLTDEKGYFLID